MSKRFVVEFYREKKNTRFDKLKTYSIHRNEELTLPRFHIPWVIYKIPIDHLCMHAHSLFFLCVYVCERRTCQINIQIHIENKRERLKVIKDLA